MAPHHFFIEPGDRDEGTAVLRGEEARHAARVLRLRPGEAVTLADGTGLVLDAVVSEVGEAVRAQVRGERFIQAPRPEIVLAQAVGKGDRVDEAVQKAVEVGVAAVVPFLAERSVVRWDASRRRKATERWRAVARAAAKQSRSPRLTAVAEVADDVAAAVEPGPPAVVLEQSAARRLREVLPVTAPDRLVLVVGPEGGLSEAEMRELTDRGCCPASLGDRVLRTETAGPVAAAVVAHVYGSLG